MSNDDIHQLWIDAIGRHWLEATGRPYETRDGETDEEEVAHNVAAVFAELQRRQNHIEVLLTVMREARTWIAHNATLVDYGHICGTPNAQCDATCEQAADDAALLSRMHRAIVWNELKGA